MTNTGSSPKILHGAVVGCGFFALNQLEAWRALDGVEIVALCDTNETRLAETGARFGITRLYTDIEALLDAEAIDFLDIATTPPSHRILVEAAARRGVAAICQKPIAPSLADARAMVEAMATSGRPFMIHENFRWQTPVLALKTQIAEGAVGLPFWCRISFRSGYDVYAQQPYLAKGERFIIEDLGIHLLDVARFLMGDVASLWARTQRVNETIKGEDVATIMLGHVNGTTSVIDCSYASTFERDPFPQTLIEIDGTSGSLRLTQDYKLLVINKSSDRTLDVTPLLHDWAQKPWFNIQESVLNIQRHWVKCLQTEAEPFTNGRDNLKTFALVEAAYESASAGRIIEVS
ncbi:Gfo/Idh/MocA family protein [Gluconobacter oxydans]|uniref:Gfo/Idh/MocA family protein n=1 Tax=Gluconobacter oxydans TaxID=442 RepID=UPI001CD8F766|nr:Gfo/Idh/MocA family oxidoreductase [Gluconobacter oxydans]